MVRQLALVVQLLVCDVGVVECVYRASGDDDVVVDVDGCGEVGVVCGVATGGAVVGDVDSGACCVGWRCSCMVTSSLLLSAMVMV